MGMGITEKIPISSRINLIDSKKTALGRNGSSQEEARDLCCLLSLVFLSTAIFFFWDKSRLRLHVTTDSCLLFALLSLCCLRSSTLLLTAGHAEENSIVVGKPTRKKKCRHNLFFSRKTHRVINGVHFGSYSIGYGYGDDDDANRITRLKMAFSLLYKWWWKRQILNSSPLPPSSNIFSSFVMPENDDVNEATDLPNALLRHTYIGCRINFMHFSATAPWQKPIIHPRIWRSTIPILCIPVLTYYTVGINHSKGEWSACNQSKVLAKPFSNAEDVKSVAFSHSFTHCEKW